MHGSEHSAFVPMEAILFRVQNKTGALGRVVIYGASGGYVNGGMCTMGKTSEAPLASLMSF